MGKQRGSRAGIFAQGKGGLKPFCRFIRKKKFDMKIQNLPFLLSLQASLFALVFISVPCFAQKPKPIEMKNNTLYFRDTAEMGKTFRQLMDKSEAELDTWEKGLGFTSNRSLVNMAWLEFEKAKTEKDVKALLKKHQSILVLNMADSTVTPVVDDKIRSALANKQGLFYVGKAVNQIKGHYLITVASGDLQVLKTTTDNLKGKLADGVQVTQLHGTAQADSKSGLLISKEVTKTNGNYRCKHIVYLEPWGSTYSYLFVTSQTFKKIAGVWVKTKSAYHDLQVTNIQVTYSGGTYTTGALARYGVDTNQVLYKWTTILPTASSSIILINSKVRTQSIYPDWATIIHP